MLNIKYISAVSIYLVPGATKMSLPMMLKDWGVISPSIPMPMELEY